MAMEPDTLGDPIAMQGLPQFPVHDPHLGPQPRADRQCDVFGQQLAILAKELREDHERLELARRIGIGEVPADAVVRGLAAAAFFRCQQADARLGIVLQQQIHAHALLSFPWIAADGDRSAGEGESRGRHARPRPQP